MRDSAEVSAGHTAAGDDGIRSALLLGKCFDFIVRGALAVNADHNQALGFVFVLPFGELGNTGDARWAVDPPELDEHNVVPEVFEDLLLVR